MIRLNFEKIAWDFMKVLFFYEFKHSSIDTANERCYNSGVLRRKGKRESRKVIERLPGKPF